MSSRKRSLREANIAPAQESQEESLVHKLRNSFYFANLYQWICIFGKVVKIDDNLDIEVRATPVFRCYATRDYAMLMTSATGTRDRVS